MSSILTSPETLELPAELLESLVEIQEQRQITVIVSAIVQPYSSARRIWPNIELRSEVNSERAKLVQAIGLLPFPNWTPIPARSQKEFCLIFEPLSSEVSVFSIVEEIPESGGFFQAGILRNKTDVYRVQH